MEIQTIPHTTHDIRRHVDQSSCKRNGDYIAFLEGVNDSSDLEKHEEEQLEFGLGYDCPLFDRLYDFARIVVGSSVSAAKLLVDGSASVAINWCGGWHHAQRDEAEGFCYVNDIVIAIHKLLKKFDQILYIDLDVHHGNGVENAFSCTNKVFTLSLHKYEPGFYPGTGSISDVGCGKGKYYTANVPLKDGIRDDLYFTVFDSVSSKVFSAFRPKAVVVQCGADCLSKDPLGTFNLTPRGLGRCVQRVLSWGLPTLFLGGGGYNFANTARCWTYLTSVIVGWEIPPDIPDHMCFLKYGPDFELHIVPGNRTDCNTKEYIDSIVEIIATVLWTTRRLRASPHPCS
ncbi:histone deacetylase 8-like [Bacillus rossius redtenbacheri]|uniref:histone deacetylase 8-like n=1 Tax=Bacillus rossius redtenbacheri TaxID=93214 RepID=UPI002FDC9A81